MEGIRDNKPINQNLEKNKNIFTLNFVLIVIFAASNTALSYWIIRIKGIGGSKSPDYYIFPIILIISGCFILVGFMLSIIILISYRFKENDISKENQKIRRKLVEISKIMIKIGVSGSLIGIIGFGIYFLVFLFSMFGM